MIVRELRRLALDVREEMALDSQEVIVRMVASGLGTAVVMLPDGMLPDLPPLARLPFGEPQMRRPVVLLEWQGRPAERFAEALGEAVRAVSMKNPQAKDDD